MHRSDPPQSERLDAFAAITSDLRSLGRQRRRHFLPALVITLIALVGVLTLVGVRGDLLQQPGWRLPLQIAAWVVCLILFPAIGVGVWFPGRTTRIGLAVGGVLLAIFATLGLPFATGPTGAEGGGSCWIILGGSGLLLLGIGAHSGAFAQRRAASSAFWLAAGIALAALDAVTWICPNSGTLHVAIMHLSPAAVLIAAAGLVGVWLHRRSQTRP